MTDKYCEIEWLSTRLPQVWTKTRIENLTYEKSRLSYLGHCANKRVSRPTIICWFVFVLDGGALTHQMRWNKMETLSWYYQSALPADWSTFWPSKNYCCIWRLQTVYKRPQTPEEISKKSICECKMLQKQWLVIQIKAPFQEIPTKASCFWCCCLIPLASNGHVIW